MKTKLLVLLLVMHATILFAQWEHIAQYNVGSTGEIGVHGSTVFLYGYEGQQYVYRSTDNGTTWTNIANKFPDKVFYVHGHGNYVFAIVGVNSIYYSTDDGVTWSLRSTISFATGAVMSLVSDGTTLYAVSNRNVVFKSTDDGNSWTQITINFSQAQVIGVDFAAVGDTMVFCALSLGTFISTDGGTSWTLKNAPIAIGTVQAHNNEIYGATYGMYKLVNNDWVSIPNGFPGGLGVTASTKSSVSIGTKIFTYYADIIASSAKVFGSDDNGGSWYEVGNNFPTAITTSLNDFLAASPQYLYCYVYSLFSQSSMGVYRYQIQPATDVDNSGISIPQNFSLSQNFPNPFNPSTKISFSIPQSSNVTLKVFNALGEEVSELVGGYMKSGNYSVDFNASKLSSGVYFYTLQTQDFIQSKKMILIK